MSLIYGDNFANQTTFPASSKYNLCSIFKLAPAVNAENLVLPVLTLTEGCYRAMFSKCPQLVAAPKILPATTLAKECCWYMFEECPITTAPVLPATELVYGCYGNMFINCGSLNYIKCLATTGFGTTNCLQNWTKSVAAVGNFVKDANTSWTTGINGIPTGWTVYNDGEEPAPDPEDGEWRISGQAVELPYSLNAIDGHSSAYAKGTYDFIVYVELEALQPTYLQFEHADQSADIYVNNTKVCTH